METHSYNHIELDDSEEGVTRLCPHSCECQSDHGYDFSTGSIKSHVENFSLHPHCTAVCVRDLLATVKTWCPSTRSKVVPLLKERLVVAKEKEETALKKLEEHQKRVDIIYKCIRKRKLKKCYYGDTEKEMSSIGKLEPLEETYEKRQKAREDIESEIEEQPSHQNNSSNPREIQSISLNDNVELKPYERVSRIFITPREKSQVDRLPQLAKVMADIGTDTYWRRELDNRWNWVPIVEALANTDSPNTFHDMEQLVRRLVDTYHINTDDMLNDVLELVSYDNYFNAEKTVALARDLSRRT